MGALKVCLAGMTLLITMPVQAGQMDKGRAGISLPSPTALAARKGTTGHEEAHVRRQAGDHAGNYAAQRRFSDGIARWHAHIAEASRRFAIPEPWIEQVMRVESGGHSVWKGVPIVSRAGAMGLMQLMPRTWEAMRAMLGLGRDPHDPRDNILAGTAYLRMMYDRFGYPGLFGAYNAGPARYQAYVTARHPLPPETRTYLAHVSSAFLPSDGNRTVAPPGQGARAMIPQMPPKLQPPLFATLSDQAEPDQRAAIGRGLEGDRMQADRGAFPSQGQLFAVRGSQP